MPPVGEPTSQRQCRITLVVRYTALRSEGERKRSPLDHSKLRITFAAHPPIIAWKPFSNSV